MLIKKPKKPLASEKKPKKPFSIVELGPGNLPIDLIKAADKSLNTGKKHRVFTGIDEGFINLSRAYEKARVKTNLRNLKLWHFSDALNIMAHAPPNSQHVIFASYLFNNLAHRARVKGKTTSAPPFNLLMFFIERALKSGGRFIMIQNRVAVESIQKNMIALKSELRFSTTREISDEQMRNANAECLKLRATPQARAKLANQILRETGKRHTEEELRPVIIIFRKPKLPKKIIDGTEHIAKHFIDEYGL